MRPRPSPCRNMKRKWKKKGASDCAEKNRIIYDKVKLSNTRRLFVSWILNVSIPADNALCPIVGHLLNHQARSVMLSSRTCLFALLLVTCVALDTLGIIGFNVSSTKRLVTQRLEGIRDSSLLWASTIHDFCDRKFSFTSFLYHVYGLHAISSVLCLLLHTRGSCTQLHTTRKPRVSYVYPGIPPTNLTRLRCATTSCCAETFSSSHRS